MKKLFFFAAALLAAISFPACSDDDDDVKVSVESLAGRWSCYQEDDWYDGELVDSDDEYGDGVDLYILEFNADGTGGQFDEIYLSGLEDESNWDRFTYTLKGAQLSMQYDGKVDECRVAKITSSELVLAYEGEDEGVKYTEKLYFRRMK